MSKYEIMLSNLLEEQPYKCVDSELVEALTTNQPNVSNLDDMHVVKYNMVAEVSKQLRQISNSKNITPEELWETIGIDLVDLQLLNCKHIDPVCLKEEIVKTLDFEFNSPLSEGYGRQSRIYADFLQDIKKMPNVEKLIAEHTLPDGAVFFVRNKDGNAYEIQIRPARYAQYFEKERKEEQFQDRKRKENQKRN